MTMHAEHIFQRASTTVMEERSAMRNAPEAGWIELFYTLGIAQAHIISAGRCISRWSMTTRAVAALKYSLTALNRFPIASAAQQIDRGRHFQRLDECRQCSDV